MCACTHTYFVTGTCKIKTKHHTVKAGLQSSRAEEKLWQTGKKLTRNCTKAILKISSSLCALKLKCEAPSAASITS